MRKAFILALLCLATFATWTTFFTLTSASQNQILPTLMILPSLTPSATHTQTHTPSPTPTHTPTLTPSPTLTPTPSHTPTLEANLLSLIALMPDVNLPPTLTPFPRGVTLLSSPPNPLEPLPDATSQPAPHLGWHRFESDHPNVTYAPRWHPRQLVQASAGQYHRTERPAVAQFSFTGEAVRLRYVVAPNMGRFELLVDKAHLILQ